jgi:hypothetical protein
MDDFDDEVSTVAVDFATTTARDVDIDVDDLAVDHPKPARAATLSDWPPPAPLPRGPTRRRVAFLPAITESKLN